MFIKLYGPFKVSSYSYLTLLTCTIKMRRERMSNTSPGVSPTNTYLAGRPSSCGAQHPWAFSQRHPNKPSWFILRREVSYRHQIAQVSASSNSLFSLPSLHCTNTYLSAFDWFSSRQNDLLALQSGVLAVQECKQPALCVYLQLYSLHQ